MPINISAIMPTISEAVLDSEILNFYIKIIDRLTRAYELQKQLIAKLNKALGESEKRILELEYELLKRKRK